MFAVSGCTRSFLGLAPHAHAHGHGVFTQFDTYLTAHGLFFGPVSLWGLAMAMTY